MKDPVSTISGIVIALIGIVSLFGYITAEETKQLEALVISLVEVVAGVIAIFHSRDSSPSQVERG